MKSRIRIGFMFYSTRRLKKRNTSWSSTFDHTRALLSIEVPLLRLRHTGSSINYTPSGMVVTDDAENVDSTRKYTVGVANSWAVDSP